MKNFVALFCIVFALLSCGGKKTLVEEYNCEGLNKFAGGKYIDAIDSFDKAIKIDNKNMVAYSGKAASLIKLNKTEDAIEIYNIAININPKIASMYEELGLAYLSLKKYQMALDAFDGVIAIDENYTDAYSNKGAILNTLKRYDEAIECYNRMVEINSNDRYAIYCKGLILMQLAKYSEALMEFDTLAASGGADIKVYQTRGVLFSLIGEYAKAIDSYDEGLEIEPDSKELNFNKAEALYNLGKLSEALDSYNKAVKLDPNNLEAKKKRDELYNKLSTKVVKKAAPSTSISLATQQAIDSKRPVHEGIRLDRGSVLSLAEQKNLTYYYDSGVRYMEDGYYERALYCFNKALAIDSTKAELYHTKGLTLVFLDKLKEGTLCLNEAVRLDPTNKAYIDTFKMINFLLN